MIKTKRNRPQKIREVYAELRSVLGDYAEPGEILECASLVVSVHEKLSRNVRCDARQGRTPFVELPLSELYARHPWKLVCEEVRPDSDYSTTKTPAALIDKLQAA